MPIIVPRREVWTRQPQYPVQLNTASMLYKKGMMVWSPRCRPEPSKVGSPTCSVVKGGVGFVTTASNYWSASASKVVSGLDVFSIAAVFQSSAVNRHGGYAIFGERGATGNDIVKLAFGDTSYGVGAVVRNTAGTLVYLTHSTTSIKGNDGLLHTLVLSKYAENSWECFYDGLSVSTTSTNLPGSGFTGSTPLLIGYDLQDVVATDGVLLCVATPGFAYGASEALAFSRNPWQLLAP